MADTTKAMLSTSLAGFYAQKAAEKKQKRAQAEYQKEYEKAVAEQAAAQAAQVAEAEREKNAGGFFGGIGYSLEKIGLGFLSGIEGIWDYTAGGLAKLFGADDWAEQQIANDWVNYNHADEWFNPSEGWQFVGDVAGGIGTSLPAIAGVAAGAAIAYFSGGTLTPVAASLIAGSVAGLGAAGRATKEAYDQTGELTGKEFGYGALSGITEGAIEGVSSLIGAGTGAVVKNVAKSFGKEVAQSATRQTLIKGMLKGFAGEAFEEGVQAILEPYYKRLTYDPNAKNATFQEVAYAALVGGLSGAIMGGADISIRNIHGASRGSTLVQNGKSGDVITTAEQISNYQTENNTDYQSFQLVQNTLAELQNSLQKTDGQVQTIKQKMLLGVLEQANTTAAFEPIVTSSAENIYNNAEAIAAKLNELGYTDTNGKPIQVTAEQLREGIDTSDAKTLRKTMSQALKTNSALRTLAVVDAIGQLSMDTAKFKDATLRGQRLSTQADLNRFIEQATDSERQAVAEKLGIENWETLTNDVFQTKIAEFVANGGVESYQQEYALVKEANSIAPESAKKTLPRMVNLRADGTYRYTQGNTDIAVIKRGDAYYVYDYDSKRMSKPLSRTETNKVLREIHTNETNYTEGVRQHNEAQNKLKQQAAELDTYARENITDYKNASASGQAAIRAVIRQGKALGLQEDFVLSCARVSARSGLRIIFSKEASFVAANGSYADGAIDLTNNRIIINPEAKSRSGEMILIHELTHAVYNLNDGTLRVAEGLETMTDVEKANIRKRYSAVGQGGAVQIGDEINAHFAEQTLSNKNILERLVEKKPKVKDKILGFFKKAKTAYAGDEKLSGAAARLYRQYKKLFDDFAARNQRYLGVESEAVHTEIAYALQEALQTLGDYDATRKRHIESNENDRISRNYDEIVDFIKSATNETPVKRLHIGTISERTAALVQEMTGVNIKDYDFVLASNFIAHIFDSHGNVATETLRGQSAVNYSNIENILETVISPDDVSLASDKSGTALRFEKELDGKNIAITITSTKKSTLTLKSAWIINKKSGGRTPSANASAFAGTSETNGRNSTSKQSTSQSPNAETLNRTSKTLPRIKTVSNNSIAEKTEKVNPRKTKLDSNKRYALSVDGETLTGTVEETNDLIALHNLSEEKLLKVLELGGFPMPSIAVTKPSLAHDNFGNITVVFGRETIDPKFDSRNKVFSRDAWTPTTPRIEYKLNEKRATEIRRKVESLVKGTDAELFGYLSLDFDNMENYLNRNDGDLTNAYGRNDAFRYAYLRDKGIEIKLPTREQEVSSGYGNATIAYVSEKIGKERLAELRKNHRPTDEVMKLIPEIERYVAESWKKTYDIDFDGELGFSGVSSILDDVYEYVDKGYRKTIDKAAASKLLDEHIDEKRYKEWLGDLFADVVEKTGIRNNKDPYTPSGNSRSFEALHDDYTLENVIRAMQKSEQKGNGDWIGISPQALAGKLSKEFKSVAEMKQNATALTGLTEEAKSNFNEVAGNMLSEIAEQMAPRSRYRDNVEYWSGLDGAQEVVGEIADRGLFTEKAIAAYMEREYKGIYDYSKSVGDKILGLFAYVKQMTQTDYFEAKPRRAVKFSEIKSVLLPDDASSRLKQRLDRAGVPYTVYGSTSEQRATAIQKLDGVRFALPETDSDGRRLTQEQREFFKDSKVVDSKGKLLKIYHGTAFSGIVSEMRKGNLSNGFLWATSFLPEAESYARTPRYGVQAGDGQVIALYADIKNPKYADAGIKLPYDPESFIERLNDVENDGYIISYDLPHYWSYFDKPTTIKSPDYYGLPIGTNLKEIYEHNNGKMYIVAVRSNSQFKRVDNKTPTASDDIRFALDGNEDGNQSYGGYSVGQRAHFAANNTGMRVYTKAEATDVINSIIEERLVFDRMGMYGELRGKDRQQVIDYLYTKLNTVKEGYRTGVALKIADFLIEHTVLTDMYADSDTSESMRILSVLRGYMHKLDLKGIQSEIRYKFDNKNSVSLVWGAKEGGIAPDTLPQVLAEESIFIESENEADIFFEMLEHYQAARAEVYKATDKIKLSEFGDAKTIKDLRQQIARDILNAYVQKGSKSKYAKLVEKYTAQINTLRARLREANAQNRLINSIVDRAQKMRDLKLGTFLNSSQFKIDVFKRSIETLAKLKYRGNFNIGGTRKVMAELRTWYTKENPVLADTYEEGIAEMLDAIANGTKGYTKAELQMINDVMAYFTNYVEKFNKVYRNGKWIDAIPEAERYINTIHSNEQVKVGLFRKMTGSTYMQTFGDPMTVARRMDMYENGFYTEMLTELREATIDAEITEMEVKADYEAFLKKHKKYLATAMKQTVKYRGVDIPRLQLIGLYMTLKRNHAQAGLAQNGFAFTDNNGKRVRVQGFNTDITEESDLRAAALDEQSTIAGLLTDADKEYITILEKAYNQDAKNLKSDRDMQRLGFTNATEEYYYPIRRGNIAKNVDTSDIQGELDRVSNSSFNKDTVRGAKQELYIESADVVFNRHIHAVTQYAALSPAIETYNRLYNLDISGNPNKPVSVATESANTWVKGNKYFSKLISDIQGIPSVSGEGMKTLGFIRGSYAKFQLGANPKVWVTQLSSLFASSSILDAGSITKGMFVSAKGVDTYCPLAKLRNSDNTAAMAQGVIDKVGKVSNVLMAPIGKMDRFVVRRLFGACQVQVEKNGGAKVGTEANKIEAGKLLKRVILETQQNTIATERSAAMRSGNEVMRTVTMFTADSMKVVGRVIDAIGEYSTLKAKLRTATDTARQESLKTQIKAARKRVVKSVTALAMSGLFMAGIAQLFKWLYDKDRDEDETVLQEVLVDFTGNLFGGLPLIKDVYARIMEGYSIENYTYSTINDLLDSATRLFGGVEKLVSGDATEQEMAAAVKSLVYSVGQLFGIPTRNIYNVVYGLTKRVNPAAAYHIDSKFYKKNYVTDLNKAIENDDTDMIAMLISMILDERIEGSAISDTVRDKLSDLYGKGYSVLPKSISNTIIYNKSEIPLNDAEYKRFKAIYSQSMKDLEKMIKNGLLDTLPEEKQAKAIKQLYDAYYYNALTDLVGIDERTTVGELSQYIDIGRLSVAFAGLSEISSEKNSKGETITGSQKKNTVDYLLKQNLTDGERLLILCYRGYTIQNGDYKGYSAKRAKRLLLKYILGLRVTQTQRAEIAAKCGFTVRNGRIVKDF